MKQIILAILLALLAPATAIADKGVATSIVTRDLNAYAKGGAQAGNGVASYIPTFRNSFFFL